MKKLGVIFLMVLLAMLAACSDDASGNDNEVNEQPTNDDQVSQETEVNTQSDDTSDQDGAAEEEEEDNSNNPVIAGDAATILQKSAEAMTDVKSFKAVSKSYDDSTINGQRNIEEMDFTMEIIYTDPTAMYAHGESVSEGGETEAFEMYMGDGNLFVFGDGNWYSMSSDSGYASIYEQFKFLEEEQIDTYVEFSQHFEVSDNGDHYLLTFVGDNNQYKETVLGASIAGLSELFQEHYDNMEVSKGVYEIAIDKETFYMTSYKMEYESQTSGQLGDIKENYKGTYELSNFNGINELTVPDEVVESAMPIGG
ncbi:hypothetical protein HNQ94_001077 [Salirhabdus euzebyi]|uniref:Lipoprotein n=1 Tax=Salirhabdus euzebyi TaxID=394506 RepID=A0A841PZ93_9BACI|nr:DUF6612 family protein [Salirhabdus euzebyi]MBB6452631.1 hypothetical protein [Salirhabdus euzebyi]